MNKKIITLFITSLFTASAAFADFSFVESGDFTGDAFFSPSTGTASSNDNANNGSGVGIKHTMPPLKRARLKIKNSIYERKVKNSQMAPTDPNASIYASDTNTSDYAIKEPEENFDENSMMPDGFEADEEAIEEQEQTKISKKHKNKKEEKANGENTENIVLDCDNVDYDTNKYCIYATGNVSVLFVKQNTTVKADIITYDRMNNTIKAEGNVKILKNGQTITGDYIFVDMNEENALIENPVTETATVEIKSKKGYVYGDKIVQEEGSVVVDESFPINFHSGRRGPRMSTMLVPKDQTLESDIEKGIVKVAAREITITERGDHEILGIRHADFYRGKRKFLKIPALKIYTNKNLDYGESNIWEIGFLRGLGLYTGPGFVFELPKGSVLKAMPILNYDSGFGVGGMGRFQSGTNFTQVAYGTANSKFLVRGNQKLDDHLFLQYGVNDYMNEWFLGRRRPKYGVDLVYNNSYSQKGFLLKDKDSSFSHRFDVGYYQDIDKDRHYKYLRSTNMGTTRFRYMAQASQNFYNYENADKQTALKFDIIGQLSAAVYGTGDTQFIGRIGPRLHTQYKRWMQDILFTQSVYDDHTPLVAFDTYRYGKSMIYLKEYFRICRFLTVSWFTGVNVSHDSPNHREFQENAFYISVGPDDFKFNLGYDFIRETTIFTVEVMLDAKGTRVDYDKLVIKQDKKSKERKEDPKDLQAEAEFKNSDRAPVLQHAVVEDIKTVEDVL